MPFSSSGPLGSNDFKSNQEGIRIPPFRVTGIVGLKRHSYTRYNFSDKYEQQINLRKSIITLLLILTQWGKLTLHTEVL